MRLLIIEDSVRLRDSLKDGLSRSGYAVDAVGDGIDGRRYAMNTRYDVIVLDLMLPGLDGLGILKALREAGSPTRVLILSARDRIQDRVNGLHAGADDYLIKPFSFDELLARIKALVRREYQEPSPTVAIGSLEIDLALHTVRIDGTQLLLTPHEMSLLEILVLNRGRVMSTSALEDRLYNLTAHVTGNTIEVHVSKIRRKLREAGCDDLIKTRRGFGYFVESV